MSSLAPESALTYLRDELGLTIERIQLALASYSERPEEQSELELAGRYLRQLRGVLNMMEQPLGTRFVHEMVKLLDLIAAGKTQDFEAVREAVLMAALRLEPFIACLERGDRDGVGVDLAGAVDQLRALRGKPPLGRAPSERPKAEPADLDRLLVRKLRPAYQRALARVVRGQDVPASLAQLLQVLEQIRDMAQAETPYRLWWTSCKLLRALNEGWIQPGPEVVPLLGKIDRKLRDQIDVGKAAFGGEQALGLLTMIESKVRESAEAAALFDDRSDYRPPAEGGLVPPPAPATDIDTLRQVAANMVDDISVAQDLVDRMAAGEEQPQDAITDLGARLKTVASVLAMVNLNSSASLLARQSERLAEDHALSRAETERLAADLVLVEDSLAGLVDPAVALVEKEAEGNESGLSPVKNRQARKAVAKQALENMVRLHELSLDLSWNRAEDLVWKDLGPTVHRVANVFAMLGDVRAHQQAERLRLVLEHPQTATRAQGENEFMVALAEVMVALELHLRAEEGSELWNVQNLERADKCLEKLEHLLSADAKVAETPDESFERKDLESESQAGEAFDELDARRLGQTVALSDPKLLKAFVDSIEGEVEGPDGQIAPVSDLAELEDALGDLSSEAELPGDALPAPQPEPQPQPEVGPQPGSDLSLEPVPEPLPELEPLPLPDAVANSESLLESEPELEPLPLPGPDPEPLEPRGEDLAEPSARVREEAVVPDVSGDAVSDRSAEPTATGSPELALTGQVGIGATETDAASSTDLAEGLDEPQKTADDGAPVWHKPEAKDLGTPPELEPSAVDVDVDEPASMPAEPSDEAPAWLEHEFLDVFLEEAEGEIESLEAAIPAWISDPEDTESLAATRRSFHTLKGSGRMVGAETAGDFAWAIESLLNRVLEGSVAPTPALGSLLQQALGTLKQLVERMNAGAEDVDVAAVIAAAQALESGREYVAPEAVRETPAVTPTEREDQLPETGETETELTPVASAETAAHHICESEQGLDSQADQSAETASSDASSGTAAAAVDEAAEEAAPEPPVTEAEVPEAEPETGSRYAEPLIEVDPELADIFAQEAMDILEAGDQILGRWNAGDQDPSLLTEMRRGMHTLKGSSRMAGFAVIGDLAHAVESLLDDMSKGVLSLNPAIVAQLQRAVDRFHSMTETARGLVQPAPADDLVAALKDRNALSANPQPAAAVQAKPADVAVVSDRPAEVVAPVAAKSGGPEPAASVADASEMVRVHADLLDRLADQTGETNIFRARIAQGVTNFDSQLKEMDQTIGRLSEKLRRLEIETEAQILFRYERGDDDDFEEFDPLELDRFSELQQLSRSLMEVVNDLTSIRNTLEEQNREMDSLLHQQEKVNRDIQDQLTRTRLVKFEGTLPRMRRVVRQAAADLGKRAEVTLEGGGEMERGLLEHVLAPLEHILRNAVAHGLETPETRRDAGKPETGNIVIAMGREGSELVVSVRDDGAGINFAAVRGKAEQAGLVAPGTDVSRDELLDCLMAPGFSTADQLTLVSGRGVGMDVVADSVRGLGGSLSIESDDGKGARFTMRMPFSLSLTHTLLVRAGGALYAVPLAGIEAMARISPEDLKQYVDSGAAQIRYDDESYDLHSLGALLGGSAPHGDSLERWLPAILVRSDNIKVALQIDAVIGSQETMVKPVGPLVNSVPGMSGATILPDGRVVLILEMAALVRSLVRRQAKTEAVALKQAQRTGENETLQVMVIDDSITMRKVTSKLLERHGIKAHLAKDGLDAAGQLEDLVPDAIVLDIEMPRMDGFELAAHIRNRDHLQDLPIIMVTSRTGEKHRQRAARLNVQEYLGKPYREEELLAALRRALGPRAENLLSGSD